LSGKISKKAQEQDSSGMVRQTVSSTLGAISYLAFSYAKNKDLVQPLIDDIAPNEKNVASGKWKIWSYEHMYTKGKPNSLTKKFLEYIDSPEVQMDVVKKLGYIPIKDMKVERDAKGFVKLLKK
jgi:phosphate transport system substrate-binding protein